VHIIYYILYVLQYLFVCGILATGCSNLIPPEDAWIKREDDKIIIGCYTSRQTWQLRCHDGRWTGVVSNCSQRMYYHLCYNTIYYCYYNSL